MMFPRRLVAYRGNLLQRCSKLIRNESTEAIAGHNNGAFIHPVAKLGNELSEQLDSSSKDSSEIFLSLKDELAQMSQDMKNPTLLQRSFGLNGPLVSLLKKTTNEKGSTVDPFQILNTLCEFQVARSPHFEVVLRYLLINGSPQDVIGLWVKYLETIAENPNALMQNFRNRNGNNNSHDTNVALTTLAYLSLAENTPDLNVLYQILQLDKDAGQQVPFNKVTFLNNAIFAEQPERKQAIQQNLNELFYQYISSNKQSYLNRLETTLQPYHLQDLYEQYHTIVNEKTADGQLLADPEIVTKFMQKFVSFNKPNQAIKIFNSFKSLESPLLKNELLLAVAHLPANSRELRMNRILAIWNSVIKPATPTASSYASLIEAIGISGNTSQLHTIWGKEIPADFKKDNKLMESYLFTVLRFNSKATFDSVANKLPEKIESIDLINAVLFKMVKNNVSRDKFDSFYSHQFMKSSDTDGIQYNRRPNIETLAIKMWAGYSYAEDLSTFDFLKSISQSNKNLLKVNAIIEKFIRIVPSIMPVRELYSQVKEPLDTRKYGNFITAEFLKSDGDYKVAEQIFKEYLESSKAQKIDRFLVEPLIEGFCEHSIRHHDGSFLLKVSTYVAFASKVGSDLTYIITAKILHTLAILAKENSGKFGKSEKEFVDSFLESLVGIENFNPNTRDLDMLRKANISVPESLR